MLTSNNNLKLKNYNKKIMNPKKINKGMMSQLGESSIDKNEPIGAAANVSHDKSEKKSFEKREKAMTTKKKPNIHVLAASALIKSLPKKMGKGKC